MRWDLKQGCTTRILLHNLQESYQRLKIWTRQLSLGMLYSLTILNGCHRDSSGQNILSSFKVSSKFPRVTRLLGTYLKMSVGGHCGNKNWPWAIKLIFDAIFFSKSAELLREIISLWLLLHTHVYRVFGGLLYSRHSHTKRNPDISNEQIPGALKISHHQNPLAAGRNASGNRQRCSA